MNKHTQKGFTLIELMIVIAIIGILAAVALPAYQNYTAKAKFSEVVTSVTAVRSGIDICYQTEGALAGCDATDNGSIATAATDASAGTYVSSVAVTDNTGEIIATAVANAAFGDGTTQYTYILTPSVSGNSLTWAATGTCEGVGLCDN